MFDMFHVLVTIFTKSDVLIKPLVSKAATVFSLNRSHASLTFCFQNCLDIVLHMLVWFLSSKIHFPH